MKVLSRGFVEEAVECLVFELIFLPVVLLENFVFGRSKHAVEAAKNCHRQHDAFILRRSIRSPEEICYLPDEI